MGEEYGEDTPFTFFSDYAGKELAESVKEGRRKEFEEFHWKGEIPNPQDRSTFERAKLNWQLRYQTKGKRILNYYQKLVDLRKSEPAFHVTDRRQMKLHVNEENKILFLYRHKGTSVATVVANFNNQDVCYKFPFIGGEYTKVLDSADKVWGGLGSSLPVKATAGDEHTIRGLSVAVFLKKTKKRKTKAR